VSATSKDARIVRTRALVQDAVRELFEEEGAGALTHQRVAQRAGVGRATVYRHWPRPIDLVVEALRVVDQPLLRLGDEPLRVWLQRELMRVAVEFARPVTKQFIATIVGDAGKNAAVAALLDQLSRRTANGVRRAFDRAEEAGEVFRRKDEDELIAELVGPLIVRVAMQKATVDEEWVAGLVDAALDIR
jgi:AcrR family transcriptional regulator